MARIKFYNEKTGAWEYADSAYGGSGSGNGQLQTYVTPEMYGAIGDGVNDDTDALRMCIESGKPILLNGKYRITDVITANHAVDIFGGGELYVANWRGLQLKNSGSIKGIGLVADSADCTNLVGFSECKNCYLENVKISSNYTFDGHASCTMVTFTRCDNVNINNVIVSDLKNTGNGVVTDSTGNMTGLYFHECTNVSINGCNANDIYTVDSSGNIILEDSNAIYVYGESTVFTITNSHFKNAGKRHIKTQCGKAHVSNCYFYHDTEDLVVALGFGEAGAEMDGLYSVVENCIFDVQVSKSGAYAISSSENLKCSNSYFFAKNYSVYLNGKHEYSNCHIEGVVLITSTGNEQNFHDCYIAKIVNNVSQTDIVNIYNCKVDHADGLINGYNSTFGLLRTRNINDKELVFNDCVLAGLDGASLFQAKGRLTNCSVQNGKQVQIQNDCLIDGFRSENLESVISVTLMGSGKTIILKNVDLIGTYFKYHTEAPTIICYPAPTNGIPAVSHSFEGAKIFNIQDYRYYVFENGAWLPAIEDSDPVSVSATFTQGDNVIYETATLESLKSMLVVRLRYESGRNSVVTNYTLSGTLTGGTSTITVTCEGLTTTFNVVVTEVTNLVPFSVDTDGAIYNTTGYKEGYRFSSTGGESAHTGAICCGFIPVDSLNDAIRITGHDGAETMASGYNRVVLYNSAFTKVGHFDIQSARAGCEVSTNANGTHEIKLVMSEYTGMTGTTDGAVYFRVCLGVCSDPSKFIVTRNKEIV